MSADQNGSDEFDDLVEAVVERIKHDDEIDIGDRPTLTRRSTLAGLLGLSTGAGLASMTGDAQAAGESWSNASGQIGTDSNPLSEVNAETVNAKTATAQSVSARDVNNIKDSKADGTGVQAAIDSLPASGGKVRVLHQQSISTSETVNLPNDGMALEGASRGASSSTDHGTRIDATGSGSVALLIGDTDATHFDTTLRDITVIGGDQGIESYVNDSLIERVAVVNPVNDGILIAGPDPGSEGNHHTVNDIVVRDANRGLKFYSNDSTVRDPRIFSCTRGVNWGGGANQMFGGNIYGCTDYGVAVESSTRGYVNGGVWQNAGALADLLLRPAVGDIKRWKFHGVHFQGPTPDESPSAKVRVEAPDAGHEVQATFTNCTFEDGCPAFDVTDSAGTINIRVRDSYVGNQSNSPTGVTFTDCFGPASVV